jgi:hypothetical protein
MSKQSSSWLPVAVAGAAACGVAYLAYSQASSAMQVISFKLLRLCANAVAPCKQTSDLITSHAVHVHRRQNCKNSSNSKPLQQLRQLRVQV